eukprot:Hpha_TRINITY_DN33516_c0_g1::TRINITY_DN33516_c0_g1_i1::g.171081::m.171081/K03341/SEPSECS; O-phospho-L-seryl-tRNASec:L-selenocysteinyl-tRNA synthase
MNPAALDLCEDLVTAAYVRNARQAYARVESQVRSLVAQRRLPDEGWSEEIVGHVLDHLALLDSNNYIGNVGGGEREGRVFSTIVKRRHFGMAHGIGRSGDLLANQPKAAGSSMLYALCNLLARDALRTAGAQLTKQAMVVPAATGMGLSLVLQGLDHISREAGNSDPKAPRTRKRWVVWSRIDQKTCLKCIYTCGFEARIVELKPQQGGGLGTDLEGIERAVEECGGVDNVLCVLSTTSCFAPRVPDDVLGIARLCKRLGLPHIVNNAYGVQSTRIMRALNAAMEHGRVDAFVQSTDKNFMVPVGGSIVASSDAALVQRIGAVYPGRASAAPVLDLFATLLQMGKRGFKGLIQDRESSLTHFRRVLEQFAESKGERLVQADRNDISICMTLTTLPREAVTLLGSSLFYQCVSGPRVVAAGTTKDVCGHHFVGYGSHSAAVDYSYLTIACAIGVRSGDAEELVQRIGKAWTKVLKEAKRKSSQEKPGSGAPPELLPGGLLEAAGAAQPPPGPTEGSAAVAQKTTD